MRATRPTSEAQRFLEFVKGDEFEVLWNLYLVTGLRKGEGLGLEWEDISFTNRTLTVRRSLNLVGNQPRFSEPKTASSKRTIAIGPNLLRSLSVHRQRQAERRLASKVWRAEGDPLFTRTDGGLVRPDYITRRLRRLVDDAGLEWIRLHGLRHTMASLALQNGTDIATVSQRLGHSNTHVTARIYLHGSEESDRQAATALDGVLHG